MSVAQLYRLSAAAGLVAAAVLTVNVLRRVGIVPTNALTHAISPLAPGLALFALTGLYLWQYERAGRLGLVGYVLSTAGFAGAVGTEVAVHFVFAHLPQAVVDQLVDGPARTPFATIATIFSLGAVLFGTAMFRTGQLPRPPVVLYVVGLAVFGWRNLLPEALVTVDGLISAAAIVWLAARLWTAQARSLPRNPSQPDGVDSRAPAR
jgi:hypothetical protein